MSSHTSWQELRDRLMAEPGAAEGHEAVLERLAHALDADLSAQLMLRSSEA